MHAPGSVFALHHAMASSSGDTSPVSRHGPPANVEEFQIMSALAERIERIVDVLQALNVEDPDDPELH